ncbi:group 1 glycosyl transferase [Lewinellaceae bacterium SD302]|nr:group 1 glycosyl transferase [Lewinellaceae bacterium SD302]
MHLGFDAKRLFNNFTGLGNYSRTLLRNLAEAAPENAYYLYSPKAERQDETEHFFGNPAYQVITPPASRRLLWRSWGVKREISQHRLDLFHGLSHELPLGIRKTGVPAVVTMHDLIYRHYPNQYATFDNYVYQQKFSYACENADLVVAISESTKADVQKFFGTPSEKIRVIYQSCDVRFMLERSPSAREEIADRYKLPESFSLYVGSLIERKNLIGIVEALALLPENLRHPLVIVGGGGAAYRKKVEQRAYELGVGKLLLFRKVDFDDLPVVYQMAETFLYPSFYEGFGIPIIEALNSGVPVITSNRSSLPEAAGPDSLLIDPEDYSQIATAWQKSLEDQTLRERMIQNGRQYAKRFLAEPVTLQWLELYKDLAK